MNPESANPPPAPGQGVLLATTLLALAGFGLCLIGMIAGLRAAGPARSAVVLGVPAWLIAVIGFCCTLAAGLWLRRASK